MFLYEHSFPVPATIGALARILTNREWEPRGRKRKFFLVSLRVFEHKGTLPRGDGEIGCKKKSAEITTRSS